MSQRLGQELSHIHTPHLRPELVSSCLLCALKLLLGLLKDTPHPHLFLFYVNFYSEQEFQGICHRHAVLFSTENNLSFQWTCSAGVRPVFPVCIAHCNSFSCVNTWRDFFPLSARSVIYPLPFWQCQSKCRWVIGHIHRHSDSGAGCLAYSILFI